MARPLFSGGQETARKDLPQEGPGSDYRYHHAANHFSLRNGNAGDREACRHLASYGTPPEGGRLRRLRYKTFATRLVRGRGASRQVVARLLDHTDLQKRLRVFSISKKRHRRDTSMPPWRWHSDPCPRPFWERSFATNRKLFAAKRPSSRIYHVDRKQDSLEPLGTCGSFSFCGLTAPIACVYLRPVPALVWTLRTTRH